MKPTRSFGSDNNSGVHPRILEAIQAANSGHVPGYGDDAYTRRATEHFREILGVEVEVFFVFGGTGANVTGLAAGLQPYEAVLCAQTAHIHVDECGALEKFSGSKLIPLPSTDGKVRSEDIQRHLHVLGDIHAAQPKIVSITQPTELGTLYSLEEIQALSKFVHAHGLLLHMDGARISNAAASMELPLRAFTGEAGVDILSFGGAKNGMLVGEAVIFFRAGLAERYRFLHKQGMQLPSKMRFIAAQFSAFLTGDLWLENARHANRMASRLAQAAAALHGVELVHPVQANLLFVRAPVQALRALNERYFFYLWEENMARWVTSFDTTESDVDGFVQALRENLL